MGLLFWRKQTDEEKKEKAMKIDTLTKKIKDFYKKKFKEKTEETPEISLIKDVLANWKSGAEALQNFQAFITVSSKWVENCDNKTMKNTKKKKADSTTIWGVISVSIAEKTDEIVLQPFPQGGYKVNPVTLDDGKQETNKNLSEWRVYCVTTWPLIDVNKYIKDYNSRLNNIEKLYKKIEKDKSVKDINEIIKITQKNFLENTRLNDLLKLPSGPDTRQKEECLVQLKKISKKMYRLASSGALKDNKLKDYLRTIIFKYHAFIKYARNNPKKCKLFEDLIEHKLAGKETNQKQKSEKNKEGKALQLSKEETEKAAITYWQSIVIPEKDLAMFEKVCKESQKATNLQSYVSNMVCIVSYFENLNLKDESIRSEETVKEVSEIKKFCGIDKFDSSILNKNLNRAISDMDPSTRFYKFLNYFQNIFGGGRDKIQNKIQQSIIDLNKTAKKLFEDPAAKLTSGNVVNLAELADMNAKLREAEYDEFISEFNIVKASIKQYEDTANKKKKNPWIENIKHYLNDIGKKVSLILSSFHSNALKARLKFLESFGNEKINWNDCIFYTTIVDLNAMFDNMDGWAGYFLKDLNLGSLNLAVFMHADSFEIGPKPGLFDYILNGILEKLKSDSLLVKSVLNFGKSIVKIPFSIDNIIQKTKAGINWISNGKAGLNSKEGNVLKWMTSFLKIDIKDKAPVPVLGALGNAICNAHKVQDIEISFSGDKIEMKPEKVSFSVYLISMGTTMNSLVDALPSNLKSFVETDMGLKIDLSTKEEPKIVFTDPKFDTAK